MSEMAHYYRTKEQTGAAYILARRSLVDLRTVLIGLITLAILMLTKKVPEPIVILAAGASGVPLHGTSG